MPKSKTIFVCRECGNESAKWAGKCPECGKWNSFEETEVNQSPSRRNVPLSHKSPRLLTADLGKKEARLITGIGELDRVLGGGIFEASVNLIAGDPGIGKSTLLLQMAGSLLKKGVSVMYVSAEESFWQIQSRGQRTRLQNLAVPVLIETELENILLQIEKSHPAVVIIDSIQAIYSPHINGAPGNLGQVRECSSQLFRAAKENGWALFLVGHITKEGSIAGPKILEHMVDVVIYFEGDSLYQYRILRSFKNRFGSTHEIGLFVMDREGLKPVDNPSQLFISPDTGNRIGSSIVCSFEGTRPILAEIQSLVARSNYGVPQRTVSGFDQKKLALLLAILEKYCRLNFSFHDVFIKIAGGLRIDDPGIDLGIAAAIHSSYVNQPLADRCVYIGEIGLNGEVRGVTQLERRLEEAVKLGYHTIYLPKGEQPPVSSSIKYHPIPVRTVSQLFVTRKTDSSKRKEE